MKSDGWEIENSPRSAGFNFKGVEPSQYERAVYELILYYLKNL